jgi:predicted nucleotidyltransferase
MLPYAVESSFAVPAFASDPRPWAISSNLRDMITQETILELSSQIAREFQPERIILFGSYAYGEPSPDSDVDLLVVLPFEGKSFRKSLEILNRINPPFPIDLLARRPDDTARRYAEGDPLIREALDRGKILYDRDRDGVDRQGRGRLPHGGP